MYNIEISFSIYNKNATEIQNYILSEAEKHGTNHYNILYEMNETYNYRLRNHCVIIFQFDNHNDNNEYGNNIVKFIRKIRHTNNVYIESIYNEKTLELIYASSYYLSIMDKSSSKQYNTDYKNKTKKYTTLDQNILDELKIKN